MKLKGDRKRQVETMKLRYGLDVYEKIGKMREHDPYLAKWASWHRWKPERFDDQGNLKKEWAEEFYANNRQRV